MATVKLLDANYHLLKRILKRVSNCFMKLSRKIMRILQLELDNAEYENTQIQEEINALYDIFTREIAAQKVVEV